ncbi:MAG TPA: zf-TFIIB domain-containing protein [Bryobacteraceae bacterium]|nr:zf-TFIIB domain-containing protein [Bryobacteraceae bacterium]
MNCPSCGAPLRLEDGLDHLVCAFCGRLHFPEKNEDGVRVLPETSALLCPVCSVPLVHAALAGQRLLYCERCRGMLLAMAVFVDLMEELRARREPSTAIPPAARPAEVRRRAFCPECRRAMDTHYYAGPGNIVIDSCSPCHLNWLDHDELRRVIAAPDHRSGDGLAEM